MKKNINQKLSTAGQRHPRIANPREYTQTMAFAALAILGHKSAHSFPIGPVMAEPEDTKRTKLS